VSAFFESIREDLLPFIPQKPQGVQQKFFIFSGIILKNKELRILNFKFLIRRVLRNRHLVKLAGTVQQQRVIEVLHHFPIVDLQRSHLVLGSLLGGLARLGEKLATRKQQG
jgi:hypothetical protein